MAGNQSKSGKGGGSPHMLEEDYFIQKNIKQKGQRLKGFWTPRKKPALNYSGEIGIHYKKS